MRPLWPIEREVLLMTAAEYPASADALRLQIAAAQVVRFENTGEGFFSSLAVAAGVRPITEKSPLDIAHGNVLGIKHGMDFMVFVNDGRVSMIEGYCNGAESTAALDFSRVIFGLIPWSAKPDVEP